MADFSIHTNQPAYSNFANEYMPVEAWKVPFDSWGMCMIYACNPMKQGMISALTGVDSEFFVYEDGSYESEKMMRKLYAQDTFEPSPFEYNTCYGTMMGRRSIVHLSTELREYDENENLLTTNSSKVLAFKENVIDMLNKTEAGNDDTVKFRVIFNSMGRDIHSMGMNSYINELSIEDYFKNKQHIEEIFDQMTREIPRIENSRCNYNWALYAQIEGTNEFVEVSLDSLNIKRTY